ncbi:hypothetical protein HK102_013060 [Quaeritorhiza haematococci]|nr:hypothetical protein HK102_013060 [Quaeritorhiza haematococci]
MPTPLSSSLFNAASIAHLVIASLGVLLNGILLFSIIKDRRRIQPRRNDFLPCLILIGGLFIWSLTLFIGYTGVIANNGITDNAVGSFICNFQGFGIHVVTGVAVSGHVILAMERHSTIILNQPAPAKAVIGHLVGVIIIQSTTAIIHMALTEPSFEPLESGTLCLFLFTSLNMVDVWLPITSMIALSLTFPILWVVYLKIYMRVSSVERGVKDAGRVSELVLSSTPSFDSQNTSEYQTEIRSMEPSESATSKTPDPTLTSTEPKNPTNIFTALQRRVLKRCVLILLFFQAFYGPTVFTIIYRLITRQRIDATLEACCTLFAELDTPVTPIMFLYFDEDVRTAVRGNVWEPVVRGVRGILRLRS